MATFQPPLRPRMFCGRIHFGPVCVNGGPKGEPICEWCRCPVSRADRIQVQRQWDIVHQMLAPMRAKKERR